MKILFIGLIVIVITILLISQRPRAEHFKVSEPIARLVNFVSGMGIIIPEYKRQALATIQTKGIRRVASVATTSPASTASLPCQDNNVDRRNITSINQLRDICWLSDSDQVDLNAVQTAINTQIEISESDILCQSVTPSVTVGSSPYNIKGVILPNDDWNINEQHTITDEFFNPFTEETIPEYQYRFKAVIYKRQNNRPVLIVRRVDIPPGSTVSINWSISLVLPISCPVSTTTASLPCQDNNVDRRNITSINQLRDICWLSDSDQVDLNAVQTAINTQIEISESDISCQSVTVGSSLFNIKGVILPNGDWNINEQHTITDKFTNPITRRLNPAHQYQFKAVIYKRENNRPVLIVRRIDFPDELPYPMNWSINLVLPISCPVSTTTASLPCQDNNVDRRNITSINQLRDICWLSDSDQVDLNAVQTAINTQIEISESDILCQSVTPSVTVGSSLFNIKGVILPNGDWNINEQHTITDEFFNPFTEETIPEYQYRFKAVIYKRQNNRPVLIVRRVDIPPGSTVSINWSISLVLPISCPVSTTTTTSAPATTTTTSASAATVALASTTGAPTTTISLPTTTIPPRINNQSSPMGPTIRIPNNDRHSSAVLGATTTVALASTSAAPTVRIISE